jgi:hypothetical protein
MKTMRNLMIAGGALAMVMAAATPTLARTAKHHYGYGAFAFQGPAISHYGMGPHGYPPAAVRPFMYWDPYGARWDSTSE